MLCGSVSRNDGDIGEARQAASCSVHVKRLKLSCRHAPSLSDRVSPACNRELTDLRNFQSVFSNAFRLRY